MAATTSSPRTSTNFSSNVTLQQTRLYVAPTEKSLTAFKAICDDIALRDTITEIVFLGVAHTFSEYDVMDLDTFKESCEEKLSCGLFTLPDNFVVDDDTLTEAYIMYDELAVAHMEDDAMFDELVTYLPKLPNLFQAGIQHKIDKPGLNEDPYFFAKDYVSADGNMAHRQSRNGCERLAYEALGPGDGALRREVAIGAFVQALHVAQGVLITHLSIGNGLHDQLWHNIAGAGQDAPEENSLHHVAANLTHLHVSVSDDINKVDDPMWREFLTAAKQLKSLTIHTEWGWDDVVWHTPQEKGSMLSVVLPHLTFKKLKTFRIIGKLDQPTNVRAIWVNAFLSRHAKTLRRLELSGVILVNWYNAEKTKSTMSAALHQMRRNLNLKSAKILFHRRSEHAKKACWGSSNDGSLCDGTCTKYLMVGSVWMDVKKLESMAHELQIELRRGKRDFGDFVMRQ